MRPTRAIIDLSAIRHNVKVLAACAPQAQLCAVVKADGYGHGAVASAQAAVEAGATWLAVAMLEEAVELRDAGLTARILVLADPQPGELALFQALDLAVAPSSPTGVRRVAESGCSLRCHLKIDTGMHRLGVEPDEAVAAALALSATPEIELEGVWSHCAVADEPDRMFTAQQITLFRAVLDQLAATGVRPQVRHLANSAGTIAWPDAHFDLVRCGIAIYGIDPSPELAGRVELKPALSLVTEVESTRRVSAGEGVSYGLRWSAPNDRMVATLPIGYADGVRRRLGQVGGEVLIRGARRPIIGTVTMDRLIVDCGPTDEPGSVVVGDEAVLIGTQGTETISANDVAARLDTIGYEIVCDLSRMRRTYVG